MPDYRVTWEIDVTAATPEAAAREALRIQRKPDSIATVFNVLDGVNSVRVDLTEIEEARQILPDEMLALGARFHIFENASGYRIVRLADGAECTFYGDDRCEDFRNHFTGDETPDEAADNADEADAFGEWCEEAGEIAGAAHV